jgi:hypothetical protein
MEAVDLEVEAIKVKTICLTQNRHQKQQPEWADATLSSEVLLFHSMGWISFLVETPSLS